MRAVEGLAAGKGRIAAIRSSLVICRSENTALGERPKQLPSTLPQGGHPAKRGVHSLDTRSVWRGHAALRWLLGASAR